MTGAIRPRLIRVSRALAHQMRLLARGGPRANVAYIRDRTARLRGFLPNGVLLGVDAARAVAIARRTRVPLTVVFLGEARETDQWIAELETVHGPVSAVVLGAGGLSGLPRLRGDVLLIDPAGQRPTTAEIAVQRSALRDRAVGPGRIGAIAPMLVVRGGTRAALGFDWDARSQQWRGADVTRDVHGQQSIPRFVRSAAPHGLLVTARMVAALGFGDGRPASAVHDLLTSGWERGWRTRVVPQVRLEVEEIDVPGVSDADRRRYAGRRVSRDGRLRIIYVLPATTMSGGIRTVFEQSAMLRDDGHDVEIWSFQGSPTWITTTVPVRTFSGYHALISALEPIDAVKVATWWETGEAVWLASVRHGIAVNYVQEFETWFYPDSPSMRAAVAASYRGELLHVTIADYQRDELADIGIEATTISSAYDDTKFRPLAEVVRAADTALAVGRSFFQKNFAMTLAAWTSLGERRPRLLLFGFEPELVADPRAEYVVTPSDARVNELLNEATCFIQTSRHEGFGLPILEAMAAGCPVITTDAHGNRDFCQDGVNCVMVEQDDVVGLAHAIDALMSDPDRQERLREAGFATARHFTWRVAVDRLEAFMLDADASVLEEGGTC